MIASPGSAVELHDEQQARVVERLLAANGEAVSFAELRAMGVENPALLCYELAAVGLAIERPREPHTGALALSVRLAPELDLLDLPQTAGQAAASGQPAERSSAVGGSASPGFRVVSIGPTLVGLAVAVAVIAVAVLALAAGGARAKDKAGARVVHQRVPEKALKLAHGSVPASAHATQAPQQAPQRATPIAAATLEADGHQLLEVGRYAPAIADLRGAIQASGGSLARCAQPSSEACLTFAYALYDLGRALVLDGNSNAGISVLSERLRIDNQREVVEAELSLARAART